MVKTFENMFTRVDRIHERDRHTDKQTDGQYRAFIHHTLLNKLDT